MERNVFLLQVFWGIEEQRERESEFLSSHRWDIMASIKHMHNKSSMCQFPCLFLLIVVNKLEQFTGIFLNLYVYKNIVFD